MILQEIHCPYCHFLKKRHATYKVKSGGTRTIYACTACAKIFFETKSTALEGLKTNLDTITKVLHSLNDGQSINAVCRVFGISKNTVRSWLTKFSNFKETLLLYSICQRFITQVIEGDELYTKVKKNTTAAKSEGWTIVLKKYQTTKPEHPETTLSPEDKEIHANHLEAFNSGLRRKLSCYRRKTNTYAKNTDRLQIRLNVHWIFHNFICKHYTTKQVPSVAQGITEQALSVADFFRIQVFEKKTA